MSKETLQELTQTILKFRDERDWKQFHTAKNMAVSLSLEASEVLELFQWKSDEASEIFSKAEGKDMLSDELSDVLYWVLIIAHEAGINLKEAFEQKMIKNAQKYPVEKSKGSSLKYSK